MSFFADRVKDTTNSSGTGPIILNGVAATGYQTFATAFGAESHMVAYCIADQSGTNWEVGYGVFNGTTGLTRATVLSSSNAGAPVNCRVPDDPSPVLRRDRDGFAAIV